MSLQVFLHGKITGVDDFLRNASGDFTGRAQWVTLLSEVLPRALLAEFGLSKMLLGSSGGGQFLLVLPQEFRERASEFCDRASVALFERSGGALRLACSTTEVLGSWPDIRQRLLTDLHQAMGTPTARIGSSAFAGPLPAASSQPFTTRYSADSVVGWSAENPAEITLDSGAYTWKLGEEIPFADHTAPDDDGSGPASPDVLASRAGGRWFWGVLRADVDAFGERLRMAATIEEHIQLSVLYKQFIIGELQMRCSLPEFWQKVSVLYGTGQSFAVIGSWDALIGLAREMQRIFALFVETNLRDLAGTEGKTISMAISLAGEDDTEIAGAYADAGIKLAAAKASGRDAIWVLGRTLEWKQLADAGESKTTMTRLIREFGVSQQFLDELAAFYRDSSDTIVTPGARRTNSRVERPWRFYRRLNAVLTPQGRGRDFQRLRSDLIADFTGKRASNVRLRPQGRVALEWARLETAAV